MIEPSLRFQSLIVLSPLAEANIFSTGENYISQTPLLCPLSIILFIKFSSHNLISLSYEDVAISLLFGENRTQFISFS